MQIQEYTDSNVNFTITITFIVNFYLYKSKLKWIFSKLDNKPQYIWYFYGNRFDYNDLIVVIVLKIFWIVWTLSEYNKVLD